MDYNRIIAKYTYQGYINRYLKLYKLNVVLCKQSVHVDKYFIPKNLFHL